MTIHFGQIYIQAGKSFPFGHLFQLFLSKRVIELVTPYAKFIKGHGDDYSLMFRISAKWQLAVNEI